MHVSCTFAEAELEINFNNILHTKRLASLYFSTSFLTCHKVYEQMVLSVVIPTNILFYTLVLVREKSVCKIMLRCKVQLQKGKSPLAAVACESTQPTLNTTAQHICTRIIQVSQNTITGKDPRWSRNRRSNYTCKSVLQYRSVSREGRNVLQTFTAPGSSALIHLRRYNNGSYLW